ncbi:MAG: hypothetical protein ACREEX_14430, partial [Caulobacteraceae bacterium]
MIRPPGRGRGEARPTLLGPASLFGQAARVARFRLAVAARAFDGFEAFGFAADRAALSAAARSRMRWLLRAARTHLMCR